MNFLLYVRNGIGRLLDLSGVLAGLIIAIIGFIITWGAISRYLLITSYWVLPVSIYLFIATSFLSAAYAIKKGEHVKVDIITRHFSKKTKKIVDTFTSSLALVFFFYLSWRCWKMVIHSYEGGVSDLSLLEIPLWIPQSFVFLGSLLMCLSLIWYMLTFLLDDNETKITENKL